MTPDAPSFKELEEFLRIDGWVEVTGGHGAKHRFFEKVLASGEVLTTHISHAAKKSPGPGRFGVMLREQLKVTRSDFWNALATGVPVPRPAPVDQRPPGPEAWQIDVLVHQVGMALQAVRDLDRDQAQALIERHWSS